MNETVKLFYQNQYMKEFSATVLSCVQEKELYAVVLDKTAFFPEGGGQEADKGTLDGIPVADVQEKDSTIYHYCVSPLEIGKEVTGKLDFENRFFLMQQHSGEHIFSGVVHGLYGFDNVGFHMGKQFVSVDFNGVLTQNDLLKVEKITNDIIFENRKIEASYPSAEELKKIDYRSKKEIDGQVRLVSIEDCDVCACCGTHVRLTGEIGIVKVTSSIKYKSGVRITLKIGKKAVEDYEEKLEITKKISNLLSLKPEELVSGVEKLKDELAKSIYDNAQIKLSLFKEKIKDKSGNLCLMFENAITPEETRKMCDILADKVRIAVVLCGNDETGYKFAMASRETDVREIGKNASAVLNGRGGGKPEMIQGSFNSAEENIRNFFQSISI